MKNQSNGTQDSNACIESTRSAKNMQKKDPKRALYNCFIYLQS